MEEDDEMQSPASAGSRSPANGRITVTVALHSPASHSPPPQPPAHSNNNNNSSEKQLMLALTSQGTAPRSGGSCGGGGREDCWSESATAVLIEAWGERYLELSRGNLKQKHWKEVADIVNDSRDDHGGAAKTDIQCKNRIDTVKKKYKLEKSKMLSGGAPSKWPFFSRLDHLIGANNGKGAATPSVPPGFAAKNNNQRSVPKVMPLGAGAQYPPRNAKKRGPATAVWDSDSSREASPVSADSFPPPAPVFETKRPRTAGLRRGIGAGRGGAGKEIRGNIGEKKSGGKGGGWGDSMRELTQAMLRFGEAYENAETAKLQQVVEMEKQRMKFAKELELQRMQFFMKTQMEFSQLKRGKRNGNTSNHNRGSTANNNKSDSN